MEKRIKTELLYGNIIMNATEFVIEELNTMSL